MIVIMRAKTANVAAAPRSVACVVYDGVSLLEFAVACEVFGYADPSELGADWYRYVVCGDSTTVRFDNGLQLEVQHGLSRLRHADTIVLPPCDRPEQVSAATVTAIRAAHARGARIISLCTGAFVLAATGLLDGRRATTHWAECDDLRTRYPAITVDPAVLYVDDGDILTSAGSAAGIDLCLHVVRTDYGAEVASRLARQLVVPPHRDGGQAQYVETPMPDLDPADPFASTLSWLQEHLADDVSVEDLADRSAMSRRTFARHFAATTGTTPYQWLLRQRLVLAQRLLETSELAVEQVAERSGFVNSGNLRKHFQRHLRTSPQSYRAAFNDRQSARSA